jgi:large subunit ribosomal protein L7Ae
MKHGAGLFAIASCTFHHIPAPHSFASSPSPFFLVLTPSPSLSLCFCSHKKDLGRFVRWPKYIRIQRQKKIILKRLKVPPMVNQFKNTLSKNECVELFKLLSKYSPETKAEKKARLGGQAASKAGGGDSGGAAPPVLKYGLKHVTYLIEKKKAKLVVIAHDVDPLELVVFLPTLCKKMDVPFCIVKSKARVGALVHKKNASCVALTSVNSSDGAKLEQLAVDFRAQFNDNETILKSWGGGIMGLKTTERLRIRKLALEKEKLKREKAQGLA